MHGWLTDFRYGARMLLKRPGTSALAITALALGIGLTTTMFSIVNGAILRGLPFDESDRLLHMARLNPSQSDDDFDVSLHDYTDWRDRQTVFEGLSAFQNASVVVSGDGGTAEQYRGARMTANTLGQLRVAPAMGRDFGPADETPGAPAVVLISHRVWETRFESDPSVVGRVLRVNGAPAEVVGVMPPRFAFPVSHDVWLPLQVSLPAKRGEGPTFEVVGRLKPGVSPRQANTELQAIAAQLEREHPENKGITVEMKSYVEEFIGGEVIAVLFTMLGAVFCVLLIACANVTNLQLARALERTKEIAIRSAIGAERWRIVRQLLVEGLLLSLVGAAVGIGIAAAGVALFNRGIVDTNPPFWIDIRIDVTVLGFVMALALVSALLSNILPALRVTRASTNDVLKDQGRGSTSLRAGLLTRVLVGGAVTLSCALLIVSGLMIKSVVAIGQVEYAYATEDVLIGRTMLDQTTYATDEATLGVIERLEARVAALPGVRRAAVATYEPGGGNSYYLTKEGQTFDRPEDQPTVRRIATTLAYFEALRMHAVAGRLFTAEDRAGNLPVTIITADFAAKYFPEGNPVGRRIRLGRNPAFPWWTIVGVVPRLASAADGNSVTETAFVPLSQAPERALTVVLATTTADPLSVAPSLRQAVREVDQDLPISTIESFANVITRRSWPFRVFGTLFGAFGLAALLMAAAGLYGVLSFGVRLRTQEIGVRIALGAGRRQVVGLIMRQGMLVVGIGLAAGLGIGWLAGPLMSVLFFNVSPTDPTVIGSTIAVLAATGAVASLVPALKASSVDPLVALRQD